MANNRPTKCHNERNTSANIYNYLYQSQGPSILLLSWDHNLYGSYF